MFDCEHYDRENGWCKLNLNWSDPMPHPFYCEHDYICTKYKRIKPHSLEDVIIAFAEAMPGCTACPLDEFCNRREERTRYVTCAQAAAGWLKTHIEEINKNTI